ncbi:MAG: hypothetical protein DRR16_31050, partial [Candidatus Parabeggiatoa sp. nov. 3]
MNQSKLAFWLLLIFSLPFFAVGYEDEDFDDDEQDAVQMYVRWSNDDRYYGDYVDNERSGKGIYIWANGDRYKGDLFEGKRDGVGEYVWANGDRYHGDYMENRRDGDGLYIWANGDRFKGEFLEGKRGEGKIIPSPKVPPSNIKITAKGRAKRASDKTTAVDIAEKSSQGAQKTVIA